MIATIGTVVFWIVVFLIVIGVLTLAGVGLLFLLSYSAWKR